MVQIYVDADAMPRDAMASILRLGEQYAAHIVTVSSIRHEIQGVNHITVDPDPQATDMKILSLIQSDVPTLVVTQDYGLAALALGKRASAISPSGFEYTQDNIDRLLAERAIHAHERRVTGRSKGPKPRSGEQRQQFADKLELVLRRLAKVESE